MGVYIKNIEIPMSGHILIVFPSGRVLEVSADATQDIFRETQAVPIPPHGRCIDADELPWYLKDVTEIVDAPTIIPAEEGET